MYVFKKFISNWMAGKVGVSNTPVLPSQTERGITPGDTDPVLEGIMRFCTSKVMVDYKFLQYSISKFPGRVQMHPELPNGLVLGSDVFPVISCSVLPSEQHVAR